MKEYLLACSLLMVAVTEAKTVAWWRMEGAVDESSTTITNSITPGKLTGQWNKPDDSSRYDATFKLPVGGLAANDSSVHLASTSSTRNSRYYSVTDDGTLRLGSLTAEAFVKWDTACELGYGASAGIFGYIRDDLVSCAYGVGFYADSINARFNDGADKTIEMPAKASSQTEPRVCDGRWHHVAITFDGETKKAALWVDYEKCGELILNGPLNYVDGRPFRIGNFGERGMVGWVDEVRISDCVLDASEFLDARPPAGVLLDEHEPAETLYRFRMGDVAELPSCLEGVEDCAWCRRLLSSCRLNYVNWQTELLEDESNLAPSVISEVPSSHIFFAANATNDFADARSVCFKGSDACKVELPSAEAICGGDFTAELFARTRPGQTFCGLIRQIRGGVSDVLWQIGLDLNANVVFSSWNGSQIVNVGYNATLDDGCWHHLAVTYREETKHIEMFFDGRLANSTTLTYALSDYVTSDRVLLLGRKTGGFDGEIDEVRVTGRILLPSEFLSFPGEMTGLPLIHFGFNGDWSNDLRSIVAVDDAAHTSYVGGMDPAISAGRKAGKYLYVGAPQKVETFWSTNTHHVSICTGSVTLVSSPNPFFSGVRSTTEAFVRFPTPTITPYSDVLTYSVANSRIWMIRIKENKPYVLFSGTNYAFNPDSDAKAVNDGGWHHLALTCEQNETATETVVELYVDGVHYAGGTASCGMPTGYSTDAYSLVAGSLNSGNYPVFDLDEVRVSPRILAPAEFLHFGRYFLPSGMAITIR